MMEVAEREYQFSDERREIKVSIIMPVYKVENYVAKAIESIQNQTLTDFEFLIVDDGTPDRSGEICDQYAERDPRITVIHKENSGAPSARNIAIDMAKGKYLYFLDSDDWAEPMMLEELYNLAEINHAQLVIAGFYIDTYFKQDQYMTTDYIPADAIYQTKEEFRKDAYKLFDKNMLYPPWNKLFLRQYVLENKLYFPTTFWDDFPFNLSVIKNIEKVAVTSKQYYHFLRARSESETSKYIPRMYEKREEEHGWMQGLYRYWGVNDANSREMIARRYTERLIGCVENVTNPKCTLTKREKYKTIKKMIRNENCRKMLPQVRARSVMMKVMLLPIRMGSAGLSYLEGAVISYVKSRNVRMFAKLKASR